jgi:hypothetical protein
MATDYDFELNRPKLARQKNLDTCWACCMSGLLAANMSAQQASEDDLVKKYSTSPTGLINIAQLQVLSKDFGYLCNAFENVTDARSVLTDRFIVDRLRLNGMLMACWRVYDVDEPTKVFFHAQIVWGVTYQTNQDFRTDRALLQTMNPATAKYSSYPLFVVYRPENAPLFTCWPATSPP